MGTRDSKGFTLIELMIVVVIIGILASIAVPNYISIQQRAQEATVKSNMHTMQVAIEDFAIQNDSFYPTDLLVTDRKLGGILCEASPHGVVVGVGINVGVPDDGFRSDFASNAIALEVMSSKPIVRNHLAGHIVREIVSMTAGPTPFEASRPELEIRDAFLDRAVTLLDGLNDDQANVMRMILDPQESTQPFETMACEVRLVSR